MMCISSSKNRKNPLSLLFEVCFFLINRVAGEKVAVKKRVANGGLYETIEC